MAINQKCNAPTTLKKFIFFCKKLNQSRLGISLSYYKKIGERVCYNSPIGDDIIL